MAELTGQKCSVCERDELTLSEEQIEIPHFGKVYVFSMKCNACGYKKSDIEPEESKEPCKYTLEVTSEADLSIKIVKSGEARVKIPHIITMEPGPASNGFITNVEGLLQKVREIIADSVENEEDTSDKKKAKNLIKKLDAVMLGRDSLKIIIEDESGHSVIISDKAQRSKL